MYYFDYASTTQPSDKILSVYTKLLRDVYLHPEPTNNAGKLLVEASNMITTSLQLNNSYDVIFTSGGTEANNLAIIGYAQNFTSSKHFITSKYEHSSVYSSFKHLESQGHRVTYLNILENGQIDYQQLADEITENTVMVAIMAVNNELGTANDCDRIRKIIDSHEHNIIYFSDCVQAAGKLDYSYSNLDMITITGHKLYAPKGIGLLAYKRNIKLNNTIYGGQQQDGIRPGTICTASAVTLGYALKTEIGQLSDTIEHTKKLMNRFINFVMEHPKIELNCQPSCSIVSVNFKTKALSESIVSVLNGSDIYASTRSACSRKLNIPSRSLTSIGLSNEKVDRTIRFSFSHLSSLEDVEYLITKLTEILEIY